MLASPVPHATALSVASKSGLVARGGDVLEIAADINLALFDKTGTLTTGQSTLKEIYTIRSFNDDEAISLASGLENKSNHPYAISILKELKERNLVASKVSEIKDGIAGIMGKSNSKSVIIGRLDWLVDSGIEIPKSIKIPSTSSTSKNFLKLENESLINVNLESFVNFVERSLVALSSFSIEVKQPVLLILFSISRV